MSQSSARSAVFLREMGIGVQWTLRAAPAGDGFAEAVQALADELPDEMVAVPPPARVTPADAPQQPHARQAPHVPQVPPAMQPPVEAEPVRSPLVAAVEAAAARGQAPPARPPVASPPSSDEDMSWFDDAPVAPPTPASATPSRAAAGGQAATPGRASPAAQPAASGRHSSAAPNAAPGRSMPAPSRVATRNNAVPPDEDTSWFDDAPVPPAAPSHTPAAMPHTPAFAAEPAMPSHSPPIGAAPTMPSRTPAGAVEAAAPVSDEAIAAMDWPTLQAAVSTCTRCALCETRRAAVNGRGADHAGWIAIAGAPSQQDEDAEEAISGAAGQLLHNMMKAIELQPEADVYVTNVVKCRPPARNPTAEEVIACRPYLDRELALTGATMAITFGQFAARGLMMGAASRGQVMRYKQLPVVATYHPDDLLRKPEDKAKAWGDLCLAKASHA